MIHSDGNKISVSVGHISLVLEYFILFGFSFIGNFVTVSDSFCVYYLGTVSALSMSICLVIRLIYLPLVRQVYFQTVTLLFSAGIVLPFYYIFHVICQVIIQ